MYHFFKEKCCDVDNGEYVTFGITGNDGECVIHDISVEKTFVEGIVFKLNRFKASIIHMNDIVQDILNS